MRVVGDGRNCSSRCAEGCSTISAMASGNGVRFQEPTDHSNNSRVNFRCRRTHSKSVQPLYRFCCGVGTVLT